MFRNDHGKFVDVTKQVGLSKYTGWWNGVATGDFNGDGRPDIVATNWGTNSRYHTARAHPMRLYYGDVNSNDTLDDIQANYDSSMSAYVPSRPLTFYSGLNILKYHAGSYRNYAKEPLSEIIGPMMSYLSHKQINTLKSMVFINKGGRFVARPLPRAAQLTAGFDASVGDYNNDGHEDIFLSQNFFDLPPADTRLDGGRGLWLAGDGTGHFRAVPGQRSGVKVYGEQRGAALADINGDGRVDLAVTQNGARTKLYQNQTPKRGYRIRLVGPPGNRTAIGASLRLEYDDGKKGPRRAIQAGSGYWSQNSPVQVMGYPAGRRPEAILVRWPDGSSQKVSIQHGKWNYVISHH
ncbi:MAG TPA: CRTAC1 family protein [Balneolaceae bacterium]|nr:CRTAC1 family protein [Balneolaceae bacterium]